MSAAINKLATEVAVFLMRRLLGKGSVHTLQRQRIGKQTKDERWKRCFLGGPCRGYTKRTNGRRISEVEEGNQCLELQC
jgi:hypothetical protein